MTQGEKEDCVIATIADAPLPSGGAAGDCGRGHRVQDHHWTAAGMMITCSLT